VSRDDYPTYNGQLEYLWYFRSTANLWLLVPYILLLASLLNSLKGALRVFQDRTHWPIHSELPYIRLFTHVYAASSFFTKRSSSSRKCTMSFRYLRCGPDSYLLSIFRWKWSSCWLSGLYGLYWRYCCLTLWPGRTSSAFSDISP